jgi:hypothetical protein
MKSIVAGETPMAQMPDALAPQPAHTLDAAERMSFIADKASPGRRAASRTETLQNLLPSAALRQCFPVARLEPLTDFRLVL